GEEFAFPEGTIKIAEDYFSDGTALLDMIDSADFTFAAQDGLPIIDAGTYTYEAAFADATKARNYRICVGTEDDFMATVEMQKAEASASLKKVTLTFNGGEQEIDKASALEIVGSTLLTAEDFSIKVMRDGGEAALYTAGDYSFEATLINDNFVLTGNESGKLEGGSVKINKYEVTVTLKDFVKEYDGKEYEFKPRTAIFAVDGSMFAVNDFEIAYDDALTDHSDARDYTLKAKLIAKYEEIQDSVEIVTENNIFTISKKKITVTTQSARFEYDGDEHSAYDKPVVKGALEGHYAAVVGTSIVSVTEVASAPYVNNTEYEIFVKIGEGDDETEKNVTGNYEIEYVHGTLEVTPLAVIITTGSASKEYDGTGLKTDRLQKVQGLLTGHSCSVPEELPEREEVGEEENVFEVSILDEEANDVTHNYAITYYYGKLKVTAIAIKVEFINGLNVDYTGSDVNLTGDGVIGNIDYVKSTSEGPLPLSEDFEVIIDGEAVNAGDYPFTVVIKSESHPERYEIQPAVGSLRINKLELEVTLKNYTGAQAQEYTGKAHKLSDADATVDQTPENNPDGITGLDLTFTGEELLNAGEYEYGVEITDETLRGNYKLTITGGAYEITPAEITVTLKNYEETYGNVNFTIDVYDAIESIEGGLKAMLGKSDFAPKYVESLRFEGDYTYEVEIANVEKSRNFNLTFEGGEYKIHKRKLVIVFAGLELSEREFAEGYGSNEYATDFDVTNCISISTSTPVANGDSFRVISATAEGLGDNLLGLYAIEEYELTNKDCYEFVNLDGETPLTAKL
ncbi:MAG: hypothetical protein K2K04_03245, partial [Clostridia bacterium]|nr:hypothetical protein [Clostridia bacterium]